VPVASARSSAPHVVSLVAMSTTIGASPDEGKAMASGFEPIAVVYPPHAAITGVVFVLAMPSIPCSAISRAQ
jgi:hypothetical protein